MPQKEKKMQDLMTPGAVGFFLGLTGQGVRYLIKCGYLKASRVGWSWIVSRDELLEYIARRQAMPVNRTGRPDPRECSVKRGELWKVPSFSNPPGVPG
jgi:hypothetical protein